MSEYSNNSDARTDNDENNIDDEVDFSSLDQLEWDLNNMNGRATLAPSERDIASEMAKIDAGFIKYGLITPASRAEPASQSNEPAHEALSLKEKEEIDADLADLDLEGADPAAKLRADAYRAQDEAQVPAPASPNVNLAKLFRDKQARSKARRTELAAAARSERKEQKHAEAVARRLEKDRERKAAARATVETAIRTAPSLTREVLSDLLSQVPIRARELHEAVNRRRTEQRMIQIRNRETDYARWWAALRIATIKIGREPSLAELATARRVIDPASNATRQMARRGLERVRAIVSDGIWPDVACVSLPKSADKAVSSSRVACVSLSDPAKNADTDCVTLTQPPSDPERTDETVSPSNSRELPWCV